MTHSAVPPEPDFAINPYLLTAADITHARFGTAVKRGLDPQRVRALLEHVAADLHARDRDLAILTAENRRLKDALNRWQTAHAPSRNTEGYHTDPAGTHPAGWAAPTAVYPPVQPVLDGSIPHRRRWS